VAREAIGQSLELLEERLKDAGALQPGLERVEAQQEVIEQTFGSVQAALSRMKVAPSRIDPPDIQELRRSVVQVRDQTRAVEQAVEEVLTVQAG
jgi:hypothetical protein